jgi:hypothetical protein
VNVGWSQEDPLQNNRDPKYQEIFVQTYNVIDFVAKIPGRSEFAVSSYNKDSRKPGCPYQIEIKNFNNELLQYLHLAEPVYKLICIKSFLCGFFGKIITKGPYSGTRDSNRKNSLDCNKILLMKIGSSHDGETPENAELLPDSDYRVFFYDRIGFDEVIFSVLGENIVFQG